MLQKLFFNAFSGIKIPNIQNGWKHKYASVSFFIWGPFYLRPLLQTWFNFNPIMDK